MKIISIRNVDSFLASITSKTSKNNKKIVESIIYDVQKNGDRAVRKYEKKFTGATLTTLQVSKNEIKNAYYRVNKDQIDAIKIVKTRLYKTESVLKKRLQGISITLDGTKIKKKFIPISSVGCYVPGGLAKYPSTAVMSIVPAKVAGVKRIVVVSPPNKNGKVDPLTLVAADICGADEIYKTGGAQAIAALCFGTKSISKVDKIVGPGGLFVTTAKSIISERTSIDMVAGPTELAIIVDASAEPELVAKDLISQAEHSTDTSCYVITTSQSFAKKVRNAVEQNIRRIKRKEIVKQSLETNGFVAVCKSNDDVIKLVNNLAPEHLEIITKNPQVLASKIKTAGLVLIGKNTPSSASDYLLGSNHILPTNGFGKTRGSLSVLDFMKLNTQIESSKTSLQRISKYMRTLTSAENLPNHYEAVRSRL
ncbi:MAG: histidinol dehydrogenase [Nitrosopumilaceae archaeon]|nr:histidinol dehydrogenase [Nitrosopumilaceae archaeon]